MSDKKDDFEAAVGAYSQTLGEFTRDDLTETLKVLTLFLQAKGLNVNFSLVIASRGGLSTIGNLSPELQWAAFELLSEKIKKGLEHGKLPFERVGGADATH